MFESVILIIMPTIVFATGKFTLSLNDTEATIGESANIECRTTCNGSLNTRLPNIEWHHFGVGEANELVYKEGYIYRKYKGRYNVSSGREQCDLIINNVILDDAGRFICMEFDKNSQKAGELIVFARFPSDRFCNVRVNYAPEYFVELSCQMEYRGNIVPYMEWLDNERYLVNSTTDILNGITISTVRLQKDEMKDSYACHIRYMGYELASTYKWFYSTESLGRLLDSSTELEKLQREAFITSPIVITIICLPIIYSITITWMYIKYLRKRGKGFQRKDERGVRIVA